MTQRLYLLVTLIATLLSACGEDSASKEALTLPNLPEPGKTDVIGDTVTMRGRISFEGAVTGGFVEDDQLDGWFFTARAGAVITLDNTNTGTTRALDSTLFLYGPRNAEGYYGAEPLIFDDDSGWGAHARITAFTIPDDGEYLVVMGTYLNIDRGNYRLTLTCAGSSCIIPCDEACPAEDPCSGFTCAGDDGCVENSIDPSCLGEKGFAMDKTELVTMEGLESDTFTVSLTAEPSAHVTLWVNASDNDEVAVFPIKVLFCAAGYTETDNGCTPLTEDEVPASPHWQRTVTVTVTGMNDQSVDGDTPYSIFFTVESSDVDFVANTPADISGFNLDGDILPDYDALDGLSDEALLDALAQMTADHVAYGYLGQNSIRTVMFSAVDLHDDRVESIYSTATCELPRDSSSAFRLGFNTEHSWPQAQFEELEPMKSDLHHIFPTDARANSIRSNHDFGMTYNDGSLNSILGTNAGPGEDQVYQVRPDRRGDIARAHFYMVARYRGTLVEGGLFDDNDDPTDGCINDAEEAVLRAWHEADPVDDAERRRNNRVEGYQRTRNPFIDRPDLVSRISNF